jgi:hypothetical protein
LCREQSLCDSHCNSAIRSNMRVEHEGALRINNVFGCLILFALAYGNAYCDAITTVHSVNSSHRCDPGDEYLGNDTCARYQPAALQKKPRCVLGGYLRTPDTCSIDIDKNDYMVELNTYKCPDNYFEEVLLCRRDYPVACTLRNVDVPWSATQRSSLGHACSRHIYARLCLHMRR